MGGWGDMRGTEGRHGGLGIGRTGLQGSSSSSPFIFSGLPHGQTSPEVPTILRDVSVFHGHAAESANRLV